MIKIGIIGGSGLENLEIFKEKKEKRVKMHYGKPSSALTEGKIKNIPVAILARHGKKHSIMPSNVNYRANIHALKQQNCTHVLASTACGSLQEKIKPGDLVILDQFIDRTTKRACTFYDKGKVCHIAMANPFCEKLRAVLIKTAKQLKLPFHEKGTIVTIEGPRFSTKAESLLFRSWKADVVNMSTVPEVVLAREAGLCYAVVAMSTDYDCWHPHEKAVTWDIIARRMKENAEKVTKLFLEAIPKIKWQECECKEAIKSALV